MTSRNIIRAPRRARQWGILPGANGTIAATTDAAMVAFDLQADLEVDLAHTLNNVTASAIRLDLGLAFAAGSAVGDLVMFHFGIAWILQEAVIAGGAALPNPRNDHYDWMAHGSRLVESHSTGKNMPVGGQIEIRNDSMRKQRENHSSLTLVVTASLLEFSIQVFVSGRVLYLLP